MNKENPQKRGKTVRQKYLERKKRKRSKQAKDEKNRRDRNTTEILGRDMTAKQREKTQREI